MATRKEPQWHRLMSTVMCACGHPLTAHVDTSDDFYCTSDIVTVHDTIGRCMCIEWKEVSR